jgi:hypothetical protein
MLTGFAAPLSFRLIVQSIVPLPSLLESRFRISNSKGFRKAGILSVSSNCFPLSDFMSMRKVLSPMDLSALPNPVIDFSIHIFICLQSKEYFLWEGE